MPARKHREGAALENWQARKARHKQRIDDARQRVNSPNGLKFLRPIEVAALFGVTTKTLRLMERREELPPRVVLNPRTFGWRMAELEAFMENRKVSAPATDEVPA